MCRWQLLLYIPPIDNLLWGISFTLDYRAKRGKCQKAKNQPASANKSTVSCLVSHSLLFHRRLANPPVYSLVNTSRQTWAGTWTQTQVKSEILLRPCWDQAVPWPKLCHIVQNSYFQTVPCSKRLHFIRSFFMYFKIFFKLYIPTPVPPHSLFLPHTFLLPTPIHFSEGVRPSLGS